MTEAAQDPQAAERTLARPGGITYIQIPVPEIEPTATFYERVFGWNVRRNPGHVGFDDASGYVSGSFEPGRAISREPGVLPYIYVDDIDATLAAARAQGAEVVREPYAEGGLRIATLRDPAGNVMGVWQMAG